MSSNDNSNDDDSDDSNDEMTTVMTIAMMITMMTRFLFWQIKIDTCIHNGKFSIETISIS